jgi:hypothetical protein
MGNKAAAMLKWQNLGGVVVDVITLLTSLSRIDDSDRTPLGIVKTKAMLTAAHALRPVLEELNNECLYYKFEADSSEWKGMVGK